MPLFRWTDWLCHFSFIVQVAHQSGIGRKYGLNKVVASVENVRNLSKKDMKLNSTTPTIHVDPEKYVVTADGVQLSCTPADTLPLSRNYLLFWWQPASNDQIKMFLLCLKERCALIGWVDESNPSNGTVRLLTSKYGFILVSKWIKSLGISGQRARACNLIPMALHKKLMRHCKDDYDDQVTMWQVLYHWMEFHTRESYLFPQLDVSSINDQSAGWLAAGRLSCNPNWLRVIKPMQEDANVSPPESNGKHA
jgi:hypothetical protein